MDGKAARQMKDENGDPLLMLNIFAQTLKVHLAGWSVHGDQTNEPGCLKRHLGELFSIVSVLETFDRRCNFRSTFAVIPLNVNKHLFSRLV
ncbi:MAG: hypothetical protein LBQ54_14170 [Planctomycetaceae bacterium]|nr:hypothetical protein [Planctomycetaceae bacterium]